MVAGDHEPVIPKLPAGTYPAWSLGTQYQAGEKVLFDGLPYQAKWSNQESVPGDPVDRCIRVAVAGAVQYPGEPSGSPALG